MWEFCKSQMTISGLLFTFVIDEQVRKLLFQRCDFWQVANLNVIVGGVLDGEVLVILLGAVKPFERRYLRDDTRGKNLCRIKLRNVSIGDTFLLFRGIEDRRAIRRAYIGSLPVKLRGIVSYRKKDAEQFAVSESRRVIYYFERFCVARRFGGYLIVRGGLRRTTRISNGGIEDTFDSFKNSLRSPKATASKNSGLFAGRRGRRRVNLGWGDRCFRCRDRTTG
jgi:hypothetical protein